MKEKLNQYHIWILVYMTQSGIVVFSLPRLVAEDFGTNGWYIIIVCFLIASFNIFLMQLVYRFGQGKSVYDILEKRIPKWILFPLYSFACISWIFIACLVGKEYILIFQMIAFPTTPPLIFMFVLILMAYMLLSKGIYSISKAATIFFYLTIWIAFMFFFHIPEFQLIRFTPFFGYGGLGGLDKLIEVYSAYIGYEVGLFLIPYVPKKTKLFAAVYAGNLFVTFIYMLSCVTAFGFFSLGQLRNLVYPLLEMLSYVQLPFVERIENFLFSMFLLKVLITTVIYFWIVQITLSRMLPKKIKTNWIDLIIVITSFVLSMTAPTLSEVRANLRIMAHIQTTIIFAFPLLLLLVIWWNRSHKGGSRLS